MGTIFLQCLILVAIGLTALIEISTLVTLKSVRRSVKCEKKIIVININNILSK